MIGKILASGSIFTTSLWSKLFLAGVPKAMDGLRRYIEEEFLEPNTRCIFVLPYQQNRYCFILTDVCKYQGNDVKIPVFKDREDYRVCGRQK